MFAERPGFEPGDHLRDHSLAGCSITTLAPLLKWFAKILSFMIYENLFDVFNVRNHLTLVFLKNVLSSPQFLSMLLAFFISSILVLFFYVILFAWVYEEKRFANEFDNIEISLIIAAKNEISNLQKNLPNWLQQAHPNFKIIIVDDHSTDGTYEFVQEFNDERVLALRNKYGCGKKQALQTGILHAKTDCLVFIDADVHIDSSNFLNFYSEQFALGKDLILGYSYYQRRKGLLNTFIQYETFRTASRYFSFALIGKPYMGVGRNLGFTKALFEKAEGYMKHSNIPMGDDDLFVQSVAHFANVACLLDKSSFTNSPPKKTWKTYKNQKIRHLQAGKSYRLSNLILLGLLQIVFTLFFGIFLFGILKYFDLFWMPGFFVLFIIHQTLKDKFDLLNSKKLLYLWPFLEYLCILYVWYFNFLILFNKKIDWK